MVYLTNLSSMKFFIKLVLLLSLAYSVYSWDTEELEIFDLVEEINQNFYELMGISHDATNQEVKRAFRNLSIILHPDKNSAEDANVQFRNLVSVYEVIKDTSKRQKYDKVLKDGLPNWKSALYYYRRMRKIGLFEGSLIIFVIFTIGQYFFAWAAYLEKKYTAEQVFGSKLKKIQKRNKNVDLETIINDIPLPSIINTLPFQIPVAIWNLPSTVKCFVHKAKEYADIALEKRRLEAEEVEKLQQIEQEIAKEKESRKEKKENLRKRRQATRAPVKTDEELIGYSQLKAKEFTEDDAVKPVLNKNHFSGGFWSDDDLVELVRLVKKYPGGLSNRWEIIAESMNRSVTEVTFMAAKLKDNGYRIPGHTDSVAENIVQESIIKKEKTKTNDNTILVTETNWSQTQQQALESAIVKYRKSGYADRWQKIANNVPEKTKEECLLRYKYLCELVKSQKGLPKSEGNDIILTESHQLDEEPDENVNSEFEVNNDKEEAVELLAVSKGKKKNKRKERRRQGDFSSDENSDDTSNYDLKF